MKPTRDELRTYATQMATMNGAGSLARAFAQDWLARTPVSEPLPDHMTSRQREFFDFIRDRIRGHQPAPSVREFMARFGINSPNGVMCHLRALERKGVIERTAYQSRGITIPEKFLEA